MKLLIAAIACTLVGQVLSHSWIACTDYAEKNGADWKPELCRGFARDSRQYANKNSFGQDRGFDHRPGNGGPACKTSYSGTSYDSEYPKAVYFPGQQVVLVHPMKNHGTGSCTNPFIPDNGNAVYRGQMGTDDRNRPYSYYKNFLVADLGVSLFGSANTNPDVYPKPGYQNAPKFCENTDRSMGTYSFNMPRDLAAGEYTFVWRWSFNGVNDLYSTCFDVIVVSSKAERDAMLLAQGQMNLDVPCDGLPTSDLSAGNEEFCPNGGSTPATTAPTTAPTTTTGRTTTTRQTTTTTTPQPGQGRARARIYQVSGEIETETPRNNLNRRFVEVEFGCPVRASFWNGRVINEEETDEGMKYEILQETDDQIYSRRIFFVANYETSCDMIAEPIYAHIFRDE